MSGILSVNFNYNHNQVKMTDENNNNTATASGLSSAHDSVTMLKKAIIEADSCSKSYEGVGLLYWMDGCLMQESPEYAIIKEILAQNEQL